MSYTVVWMPEAESQLARIWLNSRLRNAIQEAADRIDAELRSNPHDCGESRDIGRRVMYVGPVGALFEINESSHQVRVLSVWSF
jgi:hypothetical protein